MSIEKTSGELGGVRKLIQDLIAPELGWIKATLTNVQENQREHFALIREEIGFVREEVKAAETRTVRAIELNSNEIKALIKANDAERRLAEAERRNHDLELRLAEATRPAAS